MEQARKEALAAHELARARMAERSRRSFKPFRKGDKVWLDSKNIRIPYATRKIAPKREGPFVIKDVLSPLTYRLTLPKGWKIHDVFHATLLTPFVENETHGPAFIPQPPDLVTEEGEEYEIEGIVEHRDYADGDQDFLIKWKGRPDSENSWVEQRNMTNAQQAMKDYLARVTKKKSKSGRKVKRKKR